MDDSFNALAATIHARSKDTPAKRWWNLDIWHPAIGRALKINREGAAAVYALMPFRLGRDDNGQVRIFAAWPCPRFFHPDADTDWLGIETVVAFDPTVNHATTDQPDAVIGDISQGMIYADPLAFFQDWARSRAQFYAQRQASIANHWTAPMTEHDAIPGALIIGNPEKVQWPIHAMPEQIQTVGIDPRKINAAILKSARLPRAHNSLRAAA